jgi:uncharacterized C2H2 Zn-finger protein
MTEAQTEVECSGPQRPRIGTIYQITCVECKKCVLLGVTSMTDMSKALGSCRWNAAQQKNTKNAWYNLLKAHLNHVKMTIKPLKTKECSGAAAQRRFLEDFAAKYQIKEGQLFDPIDVNVVPESKVELKAYYNCVPQQVEKVEQKELIQCPVCKVNYRQAVAFSKHIVEGRCKVKGRQVPEPKSEPKPEPKLEVKPEPAA